MKRWMMATVAAAVLLVPATAQAQFRGSNLLGDFGLMSATQPAKGAYVGLMFPYYNADTITTASGVELTGPALTTWGVLPIGWFVTDIKVLGANYGFMVVSPFVSVAPEFPRFDVDDSSFGFGDLYVAPVQLGWHGEWIDGILQYGFFAPTGRFDFGEPDNLGLGMWSHEFAAGLTYYTDSRKRWHVATTAFYEIHGKKSGTDIRVGDILTLEGGLGHTFEGGAAMFGVAYYAQWKVSADTGANGEIANGLFDDHRVFGVGPELRVLRGALTIRGLVEMGARSYWEGFTINGAFMLPL